MSGIFEYAVTLASNETKQFTVSGRYFHVGSANGKFTVRANHKYTFTCELGLGFRAPDNDPFNHLEITNISGSTQTIEFYLSENLIQDNRLVGIVQIQGGIQTKENNDISLTFDRQLNIGTSATLICAEDADRKKIIIDNNSDEDMTIGEAGVTTSSAAAFVVVSGASFIYTGKPALYGVMGTAANIQTYEETYA